MEIRLEQMPLIRSAFNFAQGAIPMLAEGKVARVQISKLKARGRILDVFVGPQAQYSFHFLAQLSGLAWAVATEVMLVVTSERLDLHVENVQIIIDVNSHFGHSLGRSVLYPPRFRGLWAGKVLKTPLTSADSSQDCL